MTWNVLFVCLGNICRSPMAEAVLRHQLDKLGIGEQVTVDSAGTGDWHTGHPPHEGTRNVLDREGVSWKGMEARQVASTDFSSFDYIICMDNNNLRDVRALQKKADQQSAASKAEADTARQPKIIAFMDLLPHIEDRNVPDPYYDGRFDYVYELVDEGCGVLAKQLLTDLKKEG